MGLMVECMKGQVAQLTSELKYERMKVNAWNCWIEWLIVNEELPINMALLKNVDCTDAFAFSILQI